MRYIKEDSDLYDRILQAENTLQDLGLRITYYDASNGIYLEDTKKDNIYYTEDKELTFPRCTDTRFILCGN